MSVNNKQLREGIIAKLKDYEAYVDNELPDYIMVMLANNKTVHQINNDLQLFLGENTDRFTAWLQRAITDPAALMERDIEASQELGVAGTKRKRESTPLLDELDDYEEEEEVEEEEIEERKTESSSPPAAVSVRRDEEERETKDRYRVEEERERTREREREGGRPTAKVMKMADREGEESRTRSQRSSAITKKIIKVLQPESSRDQDLRELIAQRRKEKSHHHRHGDDRDHRQREGSDGEVDEDYDEGDGEEVGGRHHSSVASVVKMVHTERPHRTDRGGSRLLHRAILGIKSGGKRDSKSREGGSSSGTTTTSSHSTSRGKSADPPSRTKSSSSSKRSMAADQGHSSSDRIGEGGGDVGEAGEAREGSEGVEEVLVEVDEEGTMDDEFRQEQQLEKAKKKIFRDAIEKSTIAAVQKVLPLRGRLRLTDARARIGRVQRSSSGAEQRRREKGSEGEGGEEEVDLRDVLNRKKEKSSESSTRFVVTLSGAGDNYTTKDPSSDLEGEEKEREGERERGEARIEKVAGISLSRLKRYNSQAVEEAKVESVREVNKQEMEEGYEEDNTGGRGLGGLPERCRFWPNCKNGDSCPYHHPSVPCRLFPNCKYGNKCHFIHPQCKFDARCTRADCPYLHTAPRHLSISSYSSPVVAPPPAPIAPMITQPIFSPFASGFSYGRPSPWQQSRPQRYPNKSALSWTPGVKGGHVSDRQFAVPDDQTTVLPV